MMNKKRIFIVFLACVLILGACFSSWEGDEGTISISIGGAIDEASGKAAGRAAAAGTAAETDDATTPETGADGEFPWPEKVSHTITFSGGSGAGPNRTGIKGGETVLFSVAPGQWTITIEAFYMDEPKPYAEGSRTVNIKSGPNGVIVIPMSIKVIKDGDDIDGDDNAGTLRWAIEDVVLKSNKDIVIVIDLDNDDADAVISLTREFSFNDDSVTPPVSNPLKIENKSVTIRAKKPVTIKRASNNFTASFFTIGENGTLILDGPITIDGGKTDTTSVSAAASLITIDGGAFIMNDGVTLQNNINNSGKGGGVYVKDGTFTMKGGTIKGNTADAAAGETAYGGGVYVDDNGIFKKTGGTINGYYSATTPTSPPTPDDNITQPPGNGNAVYVTAVYADATVAADDDDDDNVIRPERKRNSTAGEKVNLDSEKDDEWDEP